MNLADIQKPVLSFVLDSPLPPPPKVKRTRGRSRALMKTPSSFCACALVHLSLKPGKTSTKPSGGSPRITSRRIVAVGIPAPMIPAGENSDTIFRIPSWLLPVFSVYCSEMTTFLVSGTQPGAGICHLPILVFSFRCDVGRGDPNVDQPPRLLCGVCEGDPLAPSKRQRMKPSRDGI